MSELKVEIDPAEVGLDPERLQRIGRQFGRYTDDGQLPGWLITVNRRGHLAYLAQSGVRSLPPAQPVETDTLWRIYSMSKPITSVAAMILWEEGGFELNDPVSKFIPSFADVRVFTGGTDIRPATVSAAEPERVWHLLTHTSGLTYGFMRSSLIDAIYRARGYEWAWPPGTDLAAACDAWAGIPLLFQPGTEWNYSVSTDVLGRVVEVVSGQRLGEFLARRVLGPLERTNTAFQTDDADRLASLYALGADGQLAEIGAMGAAALAPPSLFSGGGGLVSTGGDYDRFTSLLLGPPDSPAGGLDGVRLHGPRA